MVQGNSFLKISFQLIHVANFLIFQEVFHASRLRRYYLTDLESWVKWSAFISATVVVTTNHVVWWLVHVSSIAVLLAWLELMFLMSRSPSATGFYVLMFFTVANKVVRVSICCLLITLKVINKLCQMKNLIFKLNVKLC